MTPTFFLVDLTIFHLAHTKTNNAHNTRNPRLIPISFTMSSSSSFTKEDSSSCYVAGRRRGSGTIVADASDLTVNQTPLFLLSESATASTTAGYPKMTVLTSSSSSQQRLDCLIETLDEVLDLLNEDVEF